MGFLNSSDAETIVYGEWKAEDNSLVCRPLPDTGVGLLKIVIELQVQDGAKPSATSPAISQAPFGFWLPVLSSTLYCQVRASSLATRTPLPPPLPIHYQKMVCMYLCRMTVSRA
jgi:hypothetical protein